MIADQYHVAARIQRGARALRDRARDAGAFHAEIVAEDHALEAELAAQDVLQPVAREAGGVGIDLRVNHVGRHHRGQRHAHPLVRPDVLVEDLFQRAFVDRHRDVRVGLDVAVPREMLAAVGHAGQQQAMGQMAGEHRHHARIGVERAIADHAAAAIVEVEHRRERQVDIAGAQLGRQHIAAGHRGAGRGQHIAIPQLAQLRHRRQMGEAVGLAALHAAAFMVNADQHVVAQRANLARQRHQLRARLEVAREQDHAAGQWMRDAARIVGIQLLALDIEHDRARSLACVLLGHR